MTVHKFKFMLNNECLRKTTILVFKEHMHVVITYMLKYLYKQEVPTNIRQHP